jgi:VCBS repeat-containing protein
VPLSVGSYFADPDHGDTVTLSVDPLELPAGITFNPATGTFSGTLGPDDSIGGPTGNGTYPVTVTGTDASGATVTTTVVFHVGNPAPVAVADSNSVTEHGTIPGNVLTNDRDGGSDTDQLTITQVNGVALPATPGATITLPSGAQLVMAADGSYTYNPNGVYDGLGQGETATDSFIYQVSDGQGGFATATATITIQGTNDAPIVVDPAHPGVPVPPGTAVVPQQPGNDGSPITPINVTSVFADPDTTDHLTLSVNPTTLPPGVVFDPISGTFTGTPTHDASAGGPDPLHPGTYPVTVTATDSHGATVTTVVTFVIANPPPVATPDTNTVGEHATITPATSGSLLGNDHDGGSDTDPLHVTGLVNADGSITAAGTQSTLPSGALLTLNANGTYSYDPNGAFNGLAQGETATQTFIYQISDNNGGVSTATVTLTITGVNDAPIVVDPAHPGTLPTDPAHIIPSQTGMDGSAITPLNVTGYFADSDHGDTLTLTVPSGSLPPGVTFLNGVFSGTPTPDASHGGPANNGIYPITVTATDSHNATVTTIVTFTISNPIPVATNDILATPANVIGTGTVLYNDHDGGSDYDTLTVTQVNGAAYTAGTPFLLPSGALLTMNADGTYSYNPNGIADGIAHGTTKSDSFTYQVSDGQGGFDTATVKITIDAVNAAPVVIDPAHPGTPPADPLNVVPVQPGSDGSAITPLNVAGYFTDPDTGDTLTYSVPAGSLPPGVTFVNGTFQGTPTADASTGGPSNNGTYPIVVTASDGYGGTVSTIVTFQIGNVTPVAANDILSVPVHGGPLLGGAVLSNDHDGGGDTDLLHVSLVNGATYAAGTPILLPSGALLTMNTDGTYTYNPNGTHAGLGFGEIATDSFTYQVSDGQGGFANATVNITLTGVNDPPVVVDPAHPGTPPADPLHVVPTLTGSDGAPITPLTVTSYFTDPNTTDHLTLSVDPVTLPPGVIFTPSTGTFSGTPLSDASTGGPAGNGTYPVVVTADDGHGGTITTIVVFQIGNPPPVATADTGTAPEHGSTTGNVLANDRDGGGDTDPLHVTQLNGQPLVPGSTITLPSGAQLVMDDLGNYTYNPNGAFQSLSVGETGTDTFTYQVSDGQGGFATATVTISVTGVNDVPIVVDPVTGQPSTHPDTVIPVVAGRDGATITPVTVGPVFHDPDAHDTLTLTIDPATLPPGITFDPVTGTFTGTPSSDASQGGPNGDGVYPIIVTASDGHGGTVTTTVTFTFTNPPPVATNDLVSGQPDQVLTINVLGNDHDGGGDHDTLTVVSATATTGTVTINPNGTLDFTPDTGFVGLATITYTISDGQGGTSTATATVLITPNIPVVGPLPPTLPGMTELSPGNTGLTVTGAVLDAVHAADDLGTGSTTGLPTGIAASGIVDLAANQISHLGGLANRGGLVGSTGQFGTTDPRLTSPVWQLQNLISERFGAPGSNWNPEGLTGFSLRYTFAADPASNARGQIVLDSIVRDRTLIVNLSSTRIADHAHVVEYRVMQADGRPLPGWLDRAGANVLIGERPVDVEEIKLHVIAVMSDGSTIERDVVIQTNSGEIQPLKDTKRTDVMPLFSDQLRQFAERDETEFERLLTALAG